MLRTAATNSYVGIPALTVNAYGKGKAYFVGTPLDETGMSAFMAPIIKELDLKSLDTPEDVSLSVRYGDGGTRYAFLINNSAADKRLCLSELNGGTEPADRHRHQRSDRA